MRRLKHLVWPAGTVVALWLGLGTYLSLRFGPEYAYRVLVWGDSDVGDMHRFPRIDFPAAARPIPFPSQADPGLAARLAGAEYRHRDRLLHVEALEPFLAANDTTAFLVVRDCKLVYERYFQGQERDSLATSFSVAKSLTSALVGAAIAEGRIGGVDDSVTRYLPELRGEGFERITLRHLLSMSSGIRYEQPKLFGVVDAPWSDEAVHYYHPNLKEMALAVSVAEPPGRFQYNSYHPLLLGIILERTTGRSPVDYLREKLWEPLGAEYPGSWSVDSEVHRFAKMESGVNARPIDFAKLGVLYLQEGQWQGCQVLPRDWVKESIRPQSSGGGTIPWHFRDGGYYGFFWWGYELPDGHRDFAAVGKHGQIIYVAPRKNAVLVRNGTTKGQVDWWPQLMRSFTDRL